MARALAGLFPGQGSQTPDLRERVQRLAPELLVRCVELVGEDPFAKVGQSTRFAQPAILCASIASWRHHGERLPLRALAGHSLGELSALFAAGVLDVDSALSLAVRRGELMAAASREGEGMLAVLGGEQGLVRAMAQAHGVVLANDNAPGQVVLAGDLAHLEALRGAAREAGLRAIMLDVAGAFHTPAMAVAVEPFREALEEVELCDPRIPVISGSSGLPFSDVRSELAEAIVRPVRWRESMLALAALGASAFVDFGPGQVLARLVARNLPDAEVIELAEQPAASEREASGVR